MHSDCLKSLSHNEISSSTSFEVHRLVPMTPYALQKSSFERFKVVYPYPLLLGNPKMSQTTLRYTNWMHSDYAKSLIQNENSAPMLFEVRHLVQAAPCTLQKDCLIRFPNRHLLSTALGLLITVDNSNYCQIQECVSESANKTGGRRVSWGSSPRHLPERSVCTHGGGVDNE